jgi:hypothetical protein
VFLSVTFLQNILEGSEMKRMIEQQKGLQGSWSVLNETPRSLFPQTTPLSSKVESISKTNKRLTLSGFILRVLSRYIIKLGPIAELLQRFLFLGVFLTLYIYTSNDQYNPFYKVNKNDRRSPQRTRMCRTLIEVAGFKPPPLPLPLSPAAASEPSLLFPLPPLASFFGAIEGM